MTQEMCRYAFVPEVRMAQAEALLALAVSVTESLFGEAVTRLDVGYALDAERRTCLLTADMAAGRACNRIFIGLLSRELGADTFRVERVEGAAGPKPQEVPAGAV